MARKWDYAELSKEAKRYDGPANLKKAFLMLVLKMASFGKKEIAAAKLLVA